MSKSSLRLRPAQVCDRVTTWSWANDPVTRKSSFSTKSIGQREHNQWFDQSLDGERTLLIAEINGRSVGLLRLEPIDDEPDAAEVGITVAPSERGKGIAHEILEAGTRMSGALGLRRLVARVRADNPISTRVFERAGYDAECDETVRGVPARRYVRRTAND